MEANTVTIPANLREPYKITTLNDIHAGSKNCAKGEVAKKIKEIADDPYMLWIGIGDYAEWISFSDPRFDPDNIDEDIVPTSKMKNLRGTYTDYLVELFWPIREKCIAFGEGNHEEKFSSRNSGAMAYDIAMNLGLSEDRFTEWSGFTELVFRDGNKHSDSFMIYHAHGYQAGRKGGAIVNGLEDLMGFMEADIYLQGHSHQYQHKALVSLYCENNVIYDRQKVGWHCGSFLKTYQQGTVSYAERKQYRPNKLWTPTVTIHPSRDGHGTVE
jgi:hypothetical protein